MNELDDSRHNGQLRLIRASGLGPTPAGGIEQYQGPAQLLASEAPDVVEHVRNGWHVGYERAPENLAHRGEIICNRCHEGLEGGVLRTHGALPSDQGGDPPGD